MCMYISVGTIDLYRALARRHLRCVGAAQEHGEGGSACAGSVLRSVDPRPVHAARGEGRGLDADVSRRVSRTRRGVGTGVRAVVHQLRETEPQMP